MMLELAIAPSLDDLAYVNDTLQDSLMREGLGAERIDQVRLIVEELGCNALIHGRPVERPLRLQLQLDPQALVLELHDPGIAFDPRDIAVPDLAAELDQRPIGGLGLFLVHQFADHIDYHHDGAYNVVRVTLLHPYAPVPEVLS
ncbi:MULTISPECIES: ATP-binding protein [unclassified Xanthomonas]|uniref:ATP-binding protein n=1 Tax=unclassified Xanthomonas TaxID=2643310 RepID=UPI00160C21B7|nr:MULTISPECIES: ATP-binding protein [unclassified Xanthomonas]MBB4131269.1 anti-sigma regulatory factor (Ser/Thr protein kinase) [Xanthomonas sp. 3075]MBB5865103.1 anti-sigma regulatory factor (Ser/Thr protein kinase) [Xanthomonas sp. 3058]